MRQKYMLIIHHIPRFNQHIFIALQQNHLHLIFVLFIHSVIICYQYCFFKFPHDCHLPSFSKHACNIIFITYHIFKICANILSFIIFLNIFLKSFSFVTIIPIYASITLANELKSLENNRGKVRISPDFSSIFRLVTTI